MKKNNRGFTLAELLIVVAIIAVLVAIAIPVFTSQLEKSREATDAAEIRSRYAAVVAAALDDPATDQTSSDYKLTQSQDKWQTTDLSVANIKMTDFDTATKHDAEVEVKYVASDNKFTLKIGDVSKDLPMLEVTSG